MTKNEKGNLGEDFVNQLAYKSFLQYWCYPSPIDEHGDKKEIADLLILFKDVCLIISVKFYDFKGNYERYFRKTLEKATKQIYGAERKLFYSEQDVFIKHPQRKLEKFEPNNFTQIHRIVVNLGDDVQFYSPSSTTQKEKYIHVFDKKAFKQIVNELDTIPDLISYLRNREDLLCNKNVIILPDKEEDYKVEIEKQLLNHIQPFNLEEKKQIIISGTEFDLLATYLENNRQFISELNTNEFEGINFLIDNAWNKYLEKKQVQAKKREDRYAYFIDDFVLTEVLRVQNEYTVDAAKEFMSFNRFERRFIAKLFFDFITVYNNSPNDCIAKRYVKVRDTTICFLFHSTNFNSQQVGFFMKLAMESYCIFDKYQTKKLLQIVSSTNGSGLRLGYMPDIQPFDKEYEENTISLQKECNWFEDIKIGNHREKEYPDS